MDTFLQIWGSTFLAAQKGLFLFSEWPRGGKYTVSPIFKLIGWWIFLIGLPAWLIIFAQKGNWIAMSVETCGVAGIILGIVNLHKKQPFSEKWLDTFTLVCVALGVTISLYDVGGLTKTTQFLELSLSAGYLVGTYLLASKKHPTLQPYGYLSYVVMNGSSSWLMFSQEKYVFAVQQVLSLTCMLLAFIFSYQRMRRLR